jgi:HRAS-like suppressor 3
MNRANESRECTGMLPSECGSKDGVRVVTVSHALHAESELPIGSHIVTRRHGYTHHGIYAGVGQVVHYAGLSGGLRGGRVEEIALARFSAGHTVSVVSGMAPRFEGWEVAQRARSRIGENSYRLLTNNCEHFCEWCLRGQQRSYQIDEHFARSARVLHETQHVIAELLSRSRRAVLRPLRTETGRSSPQSSTVVARSISASSPQTSDWHL